METVACKLEAISLNFSHKMLSHTCISVVPLNDTLLLHQNFNIQYVWGKI